MALKAGRVGVAPDQVDEFGNINSEATSGYTKQEADAKFETQTHASSMYETKLEAESALSAKQNVNLSVPIDLLNGSALTVESALKGISDIENYVLSALDSLVSLDSTNKHFRSNNKVINCFLDFTVGESNITGNTDIIEASGYVSDVKKSYVVILRNVTDSNMVAAVAFLSLDGKISFSSQLTASKRYQCSLIFV